MLITGVNSYRYSLKLAVWQTGTERYRNQTDSKESYIMSKSPELRTKTYKEAVTTYPGEESTSLLSLVYHAGSEHVLCSFTVQIPVSQVHGPGFFYPVHCFYHVTRVLEEGESTIKILGGPGTLLLPCYPRAGGGGIQQSTY